jgi:VanZ family protein
LERFAAFAFAAAVFCLGYPRHRLAILMLLIGIIGVLEISQNYVPGRHGRLMDGLLKASGVLLGFSFTALVSRWRSTS